MVDANKIRELMERTRAKVQAVNTKLHQEHEAERDLTFAETVEEVTDLYKTPAPWGSLMNKQDDYHGTGMTIRACVGLALTGIGLKGIDPNRQQLRLVVAGVMAAMEIKEMMVPWVSPEELKKLEADAAGDKDEEETA